MCFRVLYTAKDSFVLVELLLLDGHVDLDNILPHNATSANVQVTGNIFMSYGGLLTGRSQTHPTSELPISPSLNPTAMPWAASAR
jgi:hypothetical protein